MEELVFNVPITREISVPGEGDTYTLDLAAGDQVYVSVADHLGESFFPYAGISDNPSANVEVVEDNDLFGRLGKAEFQISASEDTTIRILVRDIIISSDNTGRYSVFAQRTNNPVGATPINIGQYVPGNLSRSQSQS